MQDRLNLVSCSFVVLIPSVDQDMNNLTANHASSLSRVAHRDQIHYLAFTPQDRSYLVISDARFGLNCPENRYTSMGRRNSVLEKSNVSGTLPNRFDFQPVALLAPGRSRMICGLWCNTSIHSRAPSVKGHNYWPRVPSQHKTR